MSGATLVWLYELFDVQHAQSNQILKKTTTTSKTHVYLEVCSWGNPRKAFEPKKTRFSSGDCDWQAKRTWLNFDVCIEHYDYGTDANVSQNLKNQNQFITESLLLPITKHASRM